MLHASEHDQVVRSSFDNYSVSLGGVVDWKRAKTVGGLTFLPVTIENGTEHELAQFSHLRVLRSMPQLRFNHPDVMRESLKEAFELPQLKVLSNDFKVCIFDGGYRV
ncbi:hypothetical protein QWZ16_23895 [Vibrio ostreicida]|uniref:Uncharacterized protein n=1 Tax=Vibrio ostreicida TaxID=526588 RepID=A0ABT8C2R1_9VIBR|nr:hypothetical protein [Vibrio ostreicida]MDN3612637.1 hypothetical protein [Vibrio ostreicida]